MASKAQGQHHEPEAPPLQDLLRADASAIMDDDLDDATPDGDGHQGDESGTRMSRPEISYRRLDSATAPAARDIVQAVYRASYVDAITSGDPFDSVDQFMHRFDSYVRRPGFDLVIAFINNQPVGQTWGWPLNEADATRGWWTGLLNQPEPGFTDENGTRTFALSEIMVDQRHTGHGIAHRLHNELLRARPETRVTLLVEPDNDPAYRAYLSWGWMKVNQLRPGWSDAPLFDVLIHQLPITTG